MPFPIAHPAAVLPLRRYCRRWLNFPALVIGSLVPDAAYVFPNEEISTISHQFVGSIVFGLPAGVLALAALYSLRKFAAEMLPDPRRQLILAFCQRPMGSIWLAALSLVIGIWGHVFWDSFTHIDGWITGHLSVLQTPLFQFGGRTAKLCHLLWYISSFAGVGLLFIAFENWKRKADPELAKAGNKSVIQNGMLMALLIVPVSILHHLVRHPIVLGLTALLCLVLAVLLVLKITGSPGTHRPSSGRRKNL